MACAVADMLAARFFEYNFGDSEFLMLLLVLVALTLRRRTGASTRCFLAELSPSFAVSASRPVGVLPNFSSRL